ncbi:MAG: hypothetical protein IJI49_02180 [Bacilli bacterium]|nr:hypothetical protein [Bacilli bacterium]
MNNKKIKITDSIPKNRIFLVCLLLILFLIGSSFGRYVYQGLRNFYLQTKRFYFNSDKLTESGAIFRIENWSGVGSYSVTFNMNSFDNNMLVSDDNIDYTIEYSCSEEITCNLVDSNTTRQIPSSTNTDTFTIIMSVPTNTVFNRGDSVTLNVKTTSTSPYAKELTGRFTLVVGHYGLSHEIEDSANSPYLNVRITNTLDYYTVNQNITGHNAGTQISIEDYLALSNTDKEKCSSSIITLTYNPQVVLLDMTSEAYQEAVNITTQVINGYNYVNSISFKIDALSSKMIKFYKIDTTQNYTYPIVNNSSIIGVSYS